MSSNHQSSNTVEQLFSTWLWEEVHQGELLTRAEVFYEQQGRSRGLCELSTLRQQLQEAFEAGFLAGKQQ